MRRLFATAAFALLVPAAASAHVSVTPTLLESGREVELRLEIPGLRPGETPTTLDVSGMSAKSISSESSGRLGEESRWRVRLDVNAPPGPLPLVLVLGYADGRSIEIRQTVTVIPATSKRGDGNAVLFTVGGAVLLGVLGVALILVRRARAHD